MHLDQRISLSVLKLSIHIFDCTNFLWCIFQICSQAVVMFPCVSVTLLTICCGVPTHRGIEITLYPQLRSKKTDWCVKVCSAGFILQDTTGETNKSFRYLHTQAGVAKQISDEWRKFLSIRNSLFLGIGMNLLLQISDCEVGLLSTSSRCILSI